MIEQHEVFYALAVVIVVAIVLMYASRSDDEQG